MSSNVIQHQLILDGEEVNFSEGETLYEIAERHQKQIPTLCYDPRIEPFGACRLCVVELEGARNPVASCTTKATAGMVVKTQTEPVEKHRKTLLEMVVSENREVKVDPLRGYASQELGKLTDRYQARTGRFQGAQSGQLHATDDNPFIFRDYDLCISCNRCVRVCAEQEGDHAIAAMGRGFHKQITTEFNGLLKDSSCTFCGQCVQTCPTGALDDGPTINAPLCISYLTIEHRGPVEMALRPLLGAWVFGCDLCQEACPWNEESAPPCEQLNPPLADLLLLDRDGFQQRYGHTAVARAKRRGLARNAAIALGNTLNPAATTALEEALRCHDEALVRAHAAWALGRLPTTAPRRALVAAQGREHVLPVAREIELALAQPTTRR